MKRNRRPLSPLQRKAKKGFRGFPVGTVAFYGPTADVATKVAAAVVLEEGGEPTALRRWFSEDTDVRNDPEIAKEITAHFRRHGVRSVVMTDGLIGCPHEQGIDYPKGEACPQCPYWAGRDRFTGELIE